MDGLSDLTCSVVEKMFPPEQRRDAAEFLVTQCGVNLPLCHDLDPEQLERIRFAVLSLSGGDLDRLITHIEIAQRDWRDGLVAAGFGNDLQAHKAWAQRVLQPDPA